MATSTVMSSATGVWPIIRSRLTQRASPSTAPAVASVPSPVLRKMSTSGSRSTSITVPNSGGGPALRVALDEEQARHRQHEAPAGPEAVEIAAEIPGRQPDHERHQHEKADVGPEEVAGGDRPRVRRHEGVHDREGARRRQGVGQDRAAEPRGDREDDRQHDDEASVEEDREAEEERGDAEREGRAVLAEAVDQPVGQHLGPAGHLEQPADHRAEADEERHRGQRAAEAGEQRRHHVGEGDAGDERGDRG